MKKILKISIPLLILLIFLVNSFFYADYRGDCYIRIVPSFLPSNLNTKRIIKVLKYGSPDDYRLLCKHVNVINKNPSCGGFDGGCYVPTKAKTIYIGNDQGNLALSAALIVHETCHAIQGQTNKQYSEQECYTKGAEFLETIVIQ